MPSPQPPHLLNTAKITLERDRDALDWSPTSPSPASMPGGSGASNPIASATTATTAAVTNWNHRPSSSSSTTTASPAPTASSTSSAAGMAFPPMSLSTPVSAHTSTINSHPHTQRISPDNIPQDRTPVPSSSPDPTLQTPTPRRRHRTASAQSQSYSRRTPSVQLALANPTLSKSLCSSPAPTRTESENNQQGRAKQNFERNVRRYYYQLVVGCQQPDCANKLCRSSRASPKMTKDAAAMLSVQLAARPRLFFCHNCPADPVIHLPDSPLPGGSIRSATLPRASQVIGDSAFSPSKRRGMTKLAKSSSTRSSPGPTPAASVMSDFGHKDKLPYEPSEYSKSMPSFSVSHILAPIKTSQSVANLPLLEHDKDRDSEDDQLPPPTPPGRTGTPLFRSLLSASPFSSMFSSKPSGKNSGNSKSQDFAQRNTPSPSKRCARKSNSTGASIDFGNTFWNNASSSELTAKACTLDPVVRPRSFSPSSTNSPRCSRETIAAAKAPDILTKTGEDHNGPPVALRAGEPIGLRYSRGLQSQRVFDLSQYYLAPDTGSASGSSKGHLDKKNGKSKPLFGTFSDPDSDGISSVSSCEDENETTSPQNLSFYRDSPVNKSNTHNSHQLQQPRPESTLYSDGHYIAPPQSTKKRGSDNRAMYTFAKSNLRRGSVSSDGSISSNDSSQWSQDSQDSADDSQQSGLNENAEEVVLPYLNLPLLRQAIATYTFSRPDKDGLEPISPRHSLANLKTQAAPRIRLSDGRLLDPIVVPDLQPYNPYDDEEDEGTQSQQELSNIFGALARLNERASRGVSFESNSESEDDQANSGITFRLPSEPKADLVYQQYERSRMTSPTHSNMTLSSEMLASEGDSTFLLDSLRSVFSSSTSLGSSFLIKDRENHSHVEPVVPVEHLSEVNVGGIDLEALRECYDMLIELKPRTIFAIEVTNSIEILLARLELEQSVPGGKEWKDEDMRSIIILLINPCLFEQPYQESLLRRILAVFIALPDKAKMIKWLSCMDDEGMAQLVTLFKMYLTAHFTPRPGGACEPTICAVKGLSILYQANNIRTQREHERQRQLNIRDKNGQSKDDDSTISFRYFYSGVMEALKFKEEYQIWREGWGRSGTEKPFSYFDFPFLLSPTAKSHIINLDALTQMTAHYEDACVRHALADHAQRLLPETMTSTSREFQKGIRAGSSPYLVLELTRAHLVEEAFEQIVKKHSDLKKPLKVAFVDVGEEGMDQGGVTKEFFQLMVEKVFDPQFGLFTELQDGSRAWWFEGCLDGSSHVELSPQEVQIRLIEYELVGILVGLALYNGVILGVRFPSVVYRKLLGWEVGLDAFIESFPDLGNGLEQMLTWSDGDVYDIFLRSYEISYEHLGQVSTIPLIPQGEDIPVTNENRHAYVEAYVNHYVNKHVEREFQAFQQGFEKICGGEALKLLRPEELELLLCGNSDLDMHDLESACLYDDGYSPQHGLIKEFWEVVHQDLTPEQHKQLLVFVTGSDRVPIRGLKDLMFVIQRNGPDSDRLPTALTCFSRLLLPEYADKDKMRERLVTAIENSNGFGLV
ncbi:hypothetical protein BGZ59_009736 [Podila verticillata]|nr:hypothetical protein BGZ59_009736 [Podila verticillata]